MISRTELEAADRIAGTIEDLVRLSREPGIRTHIVGKLLGHMTAAEAAEAMREHGDEASIILAIERLCPGSIDEAQSFRSQEVARA